MTETVTITGNELTDIIKSVMAYNGREAGEIAFVGPDGQRLESLTAYVACVAKPLSVRIEPEDEDDSSPELKMLKQMSGGLSQRLKPGAEDRAARGLARTMLGKA